MALAICFVAVTALSWGFAFTIPIVFSALITVCLIAAAVAFSEANLNRWFASVPEPSPIRGRRSARLFEHAPGRHALGSPSGGFALVRCDAALAPRRNVAVLSTGQQIAFRND
jgi:hypothetical protein